MYRYLANICFLDQSHYMPSRPARHARPLNSVVRFTPEISGVGVDIRKCINLLRIVCRHALSHTNLERYRRWHGARFQPPFHSLNSKTEHRSIQRGAKQVLHGIRGESQRGHRTGVHQG